MLNGFSTQDMAGLVATRRMMLLAEQAALRRKNPYAETKNLKEIIDNEDQLMLGQKSGSGKIDFSASKKAAEQDIAEVHLRELISRLKSHDKEIGSDTKATMVAVAKAVSLSIKTDVKLSYRAMALVDGLVKLSQTVAETDRYTMEFKDGSTFKITDKWSGRATTIWGDPHVDTDDQEGDRNGEFSDLKGSDSHTTLLLQDGTRVTFTARDNAVIENVDIYKDGQHLKGVGMASQEYSDENRLFSGDVQEASPASTPLGDVVKAGGDGNDWFDVSGQMVWGQTTGPAVSSRPAAALELEYSQEVTQTTAVAVERQG